jgi:DNA recombination protein RmuC
MTLDILHLVLGLIALAAAAAAFVFSQRKPPDTAHLSAELEERKREVGELRKRAEASGREEAAALAKLGAADAKVADERAANAELVRQLSALRAEHAATAAEVASVRAKTEFADETLKNMKDAFAAQSGEALRAALGDLRKLEEEQRANREKIDREKLGAQLKPVSDTLERFEKHVKELEEKRLNDVGGLKAQIEALMKASDQTQAEARKLSTALRRGAGVQGRWGEQTLRNVLEIAGLDSKFDFQEQFHLEGDTTLRPDVVVHLPGGGKFVVDAKCSLTAYLDAQEAVDDAAREAALTRHAASLRQHIAGLSGKAYWDQFKKEKSPDFVAMFVPGDSFLVAALDRAPELMSEAMEKRVLLVTPTTLFGLCKAVAYGWRVEDQARNADEVARLGKDLYKRLSVMGGHVKGVGVALEGAVEKYNSFVGSLEGQVLTQARRFEDLKVDHEGKEIPELTPLEIGVRPLTKLAITDGPKAPAQLELVPSTDPPKRK